MTSREYLSTLEVIDAKECVNDRTAQI